MTVQGEVCSLGCGKKISSVLKLSGLFIRYLWQDMRGFMNKPGDCLYKGAMVKLFIISSLLFLLGCSVTFEQQLPLLKPGMTKRDVDEVLQNNGKWLGTMGTEEGMRNAWGYPKESFAMFSSNTGKKYYLLFDNDKFIKYSDRFLPFSPSSVNAIPAGLASPGGFSGGGMIAGGAPMGASGGGI